MITGISAQHLVLVLFKKLRYLIGIVGGIEIDVPRKILGADYISCKIQFYTTIHHVTHIRVIACITH